MCERLGVVVASIFQWLFCNSKINFLVVFGLEWSFFPWWTIFSDKHFLPKRQYLFFLQFHSSLIVLFWCRIFMLLLFVIALMFAAVAHFDYTSVEYLIKDVFIGGNGYLVSVRYLVRFCNHTKSFTHQDYANDIELSKECWNLKRSSFIPKLTWSLVRECTSLSII